MQKIVVFFIAMFLSVQAANCESISKMLNKMGVNKYALSVSIKNVSDGDKIYILNDEKPMIPASTLKLVTTAASLDKLGENYKFSTKLYKSVNNDLYVKLGADPFLKSSDLGILVNKAIAKNILEPKNVYIDSTIFDNVEWGEGWQWDDDLNPLMPKFSAYNLDGNLLNIEVTPSINLAPATVNTKPFYPVTFMNYTVSDSVEKNNSIVVERNNSIAPNILNISGKVAKLQTIKVPVNNPKRYFILRMEDAIRDKKLDYFKSVQIAKLPTKDVYLVGAVEHNIKDALKEILKNSNNFVAETLFKLAGADYSKKMGSNENSIKMLENYLQNSNLKADDVKIVDGSGVSKNNIVNANFMTDFLIFQYNENSEFITYLPIPGEGTLKNRMLYFNDSLHAKTGTLSDTSAIAGYLKTRKGKIVAFDIMMNDAKTSSSDKKNIEEQILRNVYMNY